MTIKKSSLVITVIIALAIVLIVVLFFFLSRRSNELSAAASNRFYTTLLVDELRKSSEELTRDAQLFAATGSALAEEEYNKVLAIRGGLEPRPPGTYVAPGEKRVLLELLREYGITDTEFSLVEKANAFSDDLVALEIEAMNAVKGIFKDSSGEYTIHAAPDRELALSLVFSDSYFEEVRKIMAPMDEFQNMVYNRTARAMQDAQEQQKTAERIAIAAVVLIFIVGSYAIARYARDLRKTLNTMEEMREADELTRIMFNATPLSINLIDKNLNFIDCNEETIKLFCIKDKQEYLKNFYNFSPEYQPDGKPSKEEAVKHLTKALEEGHDRSGWTHQDLNGELIPCEVDLVRIKYKGDYAIAGYAHDLREIKAKEAEARKANERTNIMFNAMPLCASYWTREPKIIDCNDEVVRLFELADKQEYIDRFGELSPEFQPDGSPSAETAAILVLKAYEEGYCHFEWMMQKLNGEPIPIDIDLIRIEYGSDYIVVAYFRDLRKIKAIEAEAREADELTRIMLDVMPLSCSLIDSNYNFIDCNKEAEKLFGFSNKQEYLARFFEFSPKFQPDGQLSQDKAFAFFKKAFDEGDAFFEWLHIDTAGKPIPCEVTLVRVKYKDEYILAGYTRDMREIKAAVARIRVADERTQIIFDTSPIGSLMFDKEFNIFDCNQEAVRIFALQNKNEFIERFFELSPEYQSCGKKSYDMMIENNNKVFEEGYHRFEWMYQSLSGEPIPCETTLVRVIYRNEYNIAGYIRDLREQKALLEKIRLENEKYMMKVKQQAEAEAASSAKSSFLSTMSHEMRTPMNAIIGMTTVGRKTTDTERKNYSLNRIESASRHLLGIINDVLDMSKIEANKLELSNISFNLRHSLDKAVSLIQFIVEEKQINFSMNVSDKTPSYLIGDDQRLTQVITNLLSNAAKFTPKYGNINLDVSFMGEENKICELCFEVADNGIGISYEQQEKIFRPFEQAENGTTRKFGGTGLGLVITKRIIELMDGVIWVESEIGNGSRFIFTVKLPRDENGFPLQKDSDVREEIATNDIRTKFKGKQVLIVEDIEINREVLISLLEDTELIIETAENGKEALDMVMAAPDKYDLIFMDMQMPVMDGLEATRKIRALPPARSRKLPIIAMTANVFQEDIEKCRVAGMDAHIGKPLELTKVLEKLREYL